MPSVLPRILFVGAVFVLSVVSVWVALVDSDLPPALVPMSAVVYSEVLDPMQARQATFGPEINQTEGIHGPMALVSTLGCSAPDPPAYLDHYQGDSGGSLRGKIAVVQRGGCNFYTKVLNIQKMGADAVIVGDNEYGSLVTMYAQNDTGEVTVPSVFISRYSYNLLKSSAENIKEVTIISDSSPSTILDTLLFLLVSPVFSIALIYILLVTRRQLIKRRERAPPKIVNSLPTWIYQGSNSNHESHPSWSSTKECVICLDPYKNGESLIMKLPCDHEFHEECVRRWLIDHHKTCPICKRDITQQTSTSSNNDEELRLLANTENQIISMVL